VSLLALAIATLAAKRERERERDGNCSLGWPFRKFEPNVAAV
jgi:hypothetical protein